MGNTEDRFAAHQREELQYMAGCLHGFQQGVLDKRAAMIEFIVENAGWIGEARELSLQFLEDAYEVETRWYMYHGDWEEGE